MIDLRGAKELEARLRAVQRAPITGLRRLGLRAVREQKRLVPRKTGNLARSIHLVRVTPVAAVTAASASYAAAVERGTRPHIIRPRSRRVLRFATAGSATLSGRPRSGAPVVFAKFVRHPGTKPQPYMVPGAQEALAQEGFKVEIIDAWNGAA